MKIVVLDGYALNPGDLSWDRIREQGDFNYYDNTEKEDAVIRIGSAEIVFTNRTYITSDVLDKCPNLKYVGVLSTGYNVVDIKACKERGITVTNIPTYGTYTVAQYSMAMILELCHHIGEHYQSVQNGDWQNNKNFSYWIYPTVELNGKTLGIVGLGRIGQALANIALAFGMNVIAYDKYPNDKFLVKGVNYCAMEDLLSKSDFISLNCPLTEDNKGMINSKTISLMKDGVFIVNTARGPLINENDLLDALNSGKVKGAAIDVLAEEPPINGNPLIDSPKCIVTPHIAWAAREARERLMNIAADNLKAYIQGNPINTI